MDWLILSLTAAGLWSDASVVDLVFVHKVESNSYSQLYGFLYGFGRGFGLDGYGVGIYCEGGT